MDQNHISQEIATVFPSNSPNSPRTFKNQIESNSSNSPPKSKIPFASCSLISLFQLFHQFLGYNLTNLSCSKCAHQWWIEVSHAWSCFGSSYKLHSLLQALISIFFEESRPKAHGFITAPFKVPKIESHGFLNCDMLFEVRLM